MISCFNFLEPEASRHRTRLYLYLYLTTWNTFRDGIFSPTSEKGIYYIIKCLPVHFILNPGYIEFELSVITNQAQNVEIMIIQRWIDVKTLNRRCFNVVCLLGMAWNILDSSGVRNHDLLLASWLHKPLHHITKTRLYNIDPLKPHFYTVKLGFTGVYIIFLISAQKHRLWVFVRTASQRRF